MIHLPRRSPAWSCTTALPCGGSSAMRKCISTIRGCYLYVLMLSCDVRGRRHSTLWSSHDQTLSIASLCDIWIAIDINSFPERVYVSEYKVSGRGSTMVYTHSLNIIEGWGSHEAILESLYTSSRVLNLLVAHQTAMRS